MVSLLLRLTPVKTLVELWTATLVVISKLSPTSPYQSNNQYYWLWIIMVNYISNGWKSAFTWALLDEDSCLLLERRVVFGLVTLSTTLKRKKKKMNDIKTEFGGFQMIQMKGIQMKRWLPISNWAKGRKQMLPGQPSNCLCFHAGLPSLIRTYFGKFLRCPSPDSFQYSYHV